MKRFLLIALILVSAQAIGQIQKAYGDGEWFKFRIHYGLLTAGYATLEVEQTTLNGKQVYHIIGEGKTTGVSRWFFKVEDYYQSYVDIDRDIPYRFIRKIDEGGHTKDIQIEFDHTASQALVNNKKHNTEVTYSFPKDTQDMVSAFYYLRNRLDVRTLKEGDVTELNMFFDKENFKFRLKFLGREIVSTKFGDVSCLIFRPYVLAGRVFKEKESLTVWISDDDNRMPVRISASLAVGSIKADLIDFKGLKHSFKIVVD